MSRKKADDLPAEEPGSRQENGRVDEQERATDKHLKLRQEIEKSQGEFEEAIMDLRDVVEDQIEKVDIRRRIASKPWPWLAGGFALGLMLGLRGR